MRDLTEQTMLLHQVIEVINKRCPRVAAEVGPILVGVGTHIENQESIIIQLAALPRVTLPFNAVPARLDILNN